MASGGRTRRPVLRHGFEVSRRSLMHGRTKRVGSWIRAGVPALLVAGVALGAPPKKNQAPTLTPQVSGTTNRLQAVSPVNSPGGLGERRGRDVCPHHRRRRALGVARRPGRRNAAVPRRRGVSAEVAYLLASGGGTDSRIYKTENGGATWELQAQNADPTGFWDCFAFWTPTKGLTMADSVNGRFPVMPHSGRRDLAGHRRPAARAAARRRVRVRGERHVRRDVRQEVRVDRDGEHDDGVADPGHAGPG
jgi:hypothetical protein